MQGMPLQRYRHHHNLNSQIKLHQKCKHLLGRLHKMQSSACNINDSRNLCSHSKCNHFIYVCTIKRRLHNFIQLSKMKSNTCISLDYKTVCRQPICSHTAYGSLLAYLHILARFAFTRMCRHTIARNAWCLHHAWQRYAFAPSLVGYSKTTSNK